MSTYVFASKTFSSCSVSVADSSLFLSFSGARYSFALDSVVSSISCLTALTPCLQIRLLADNHFFYAYTRKRLIFRVVLKDATIVSYKI